MDKEKESLLSDQSSVEKSDDAQPVRDSGPTDTGKRIDVSKVVLKSHMVQSLEARKESAKSRPKKRPVPRPSQEKAPEKPVLKSKPQEADSTNGAAKNAAQMPSEAIVRPKPEMAAPKPKVVLEPKIFDDSGDFAAMLEASGPVERATYSVGDKVRAVLIHTSKDTAFFSIGQRHEGAMPLAELLDEQGQVSLKAGQTIDAFVVDISDSILLSRKVGRHMADLDMLEEAKNARMPIEGKVTAVNSGGYEVALAGTRGFCPLGQMDVNYIEDPKALIGKSFDFWVQQISGNGRNIVLSRKALMEAEQVQKQKERIKDLNVGDQVTAQITRLADFGAFADLGGIEGLIPMSQLSFSRIESASDRVSVGDLVKVEVMRIEPDQRKEGLWRISLSLKAAMPDPFLEHQDRLVPGQSMEGRVARLEDFGAFVELFDGVDGLIHISELSEQRVRHPSEVLKVGDPVTVRILDVDREKRRIGLSLRENVQRTKDAAPMGPQLKRGDQFEGVVERIERYGVFLKSPNGQSALLPAAESGVPKGSDLSKSFGLGDTVSVLVIDVDDRHRVRVSKVAREKAEERASFESFTKGQESSGKLGTLGDLLSKFKK